MSDVSVLFARADSVYKSFDRCDVWDQQRDARFFLGNEPVVAHPPCRGWGRMRKQSKPLDHEKDLALLAVWQTRLNHGVLEHPEASDLWRVMSLPRPGRGFDDFGGWTLSVDQFWFGHEARKRTWLYIVGVQPASIPSFPLVLGHAPKRIGSGNSPEITKSEREKTPPLFAKWLVELAALSKPSQSLHLFKNKSD